MPGAIASIAADLVPFALVDVGWRGRMAHALASAIQGSQLALPKRLLYFGLTAEAQQLHNTARSAKSEAWFFGCAGGQARVQSPPNLSALIEVLSAERTTLYTIGSRTT
ncbi:MAG: hypothetical protein ACR2M1_07190 [Gemmatimonadaceae bacterium]